jgi:hypothetical protein
MNQRLTGIAAVAGVFLITGCANAPDPLESKASVKRLSDIPTGPISAFTAFYKMYEPARKWSSDIQAASVAALDAETIGSNDGKCSAWQAVFVSASKRQSQTYTYSTIELGTITKGLSGGKSTAWLGATPEARPFSNSEMSVDSDAAYKAAVEKASDWLKNNSAKPITTFALGDANRFPAPTWYILWGTKKGGYGVYVNASTGKVLGK